VWVKGVFNTHLQGHEEYEDFEQEDISKTTIHHGRDNANAEAADRKYAGLQTIVGEQRLSAEKNMHELSALDMLQMAAACAASAGDTGSGGVHHPTAEAHGDQSDDEDAAADTREGIFGRGSGKTKKAGGGGSAARAASAKAATRRPGCPSPGPVGAPFTSTATVGPAASPAATRAAAVSAPPSGGQAADSSAARSTANTINDGRNARLLEGIDQDLQKLRVRRDALALDVGMDDAVHLLGMSPAFLMAMRERQTAFGKLIADIRLQIVRIDRSKAGDAFVGYKTELQQFSKAIGLQVALLKAVSAPQRTHPDILEARRALEEAGASISSTLDICCWHSEAYVHVMHQNFNGFQAALQDAQAPDGVGERAHAVVEAIFDDLITVALNKIKPAEITKKNAATTAMVQAIASTARQRLDFPLLVETASALCSMMQRDNLVGLSEATTYVLKFN